MAAIEAKHDGLRDDTKTIRASIHDINNEFQKFSGVERLWTTNLDNLTLQVSGVVTQMAALTKSVGDLTTLRDKGLGVWATVTRITVIVTGMLAAAGGIAAIFLALHPH